MPFLHAGHQPENWSDVIRPGEVLPWARVMKIPAEGETNYANSLYSDGELAGAYCLCGVGHDSTEQQVRGKVTFWALDLAEDLEDGRKAKPRSLDILRRIHAAAEQLNLPHIGCDTRKHWARIYCLTDQDARKWLKAADDMKEYLCPVTEGPISMWKCVKPTRDKVGLDSAVHQFVHIPELTSEDGTAVWQKICALLIGISFIVGVVSLLRYLGFA